MSSMSKTFDHLSVEIGRTVTNEYPVRITPGPFEVSPDVGRAFSQSPVGHRTPQFRQVMKQNASMLLKAFEIDPDDNYFAVVLPGTGTCAMESMVAAVVNKRRPLVLVNGRFSKRLADIASIHNIETLVLDFGTGNSFDLERILDTLDATGDIGALLFAIQDTREAILNPFESVCCIAKERNLFVAVDGISALVCEDVRPSTLGIDFFTESSGKGIRSLPGLGIVCGKTKRFAELDPRCCQTYYLNLAEHYRSQRVLQEPLFADSVALHYALHAALEELLREPVWMRRQAIQKRTLGVRESLRALGLSFLQPVNCMPNSVTSVRLPEGFSFTSFQQRLMTRGFLVYPGSSVYTDCFQIGTAGYLSDSVLQYAIGAIKDTLWSGE